MRCVGAQRGALAQTLTDAGVQENVCKAMTRMCDQTEITTHLKRTTSTHRRDAGYWHLCRPLPTPVARPHRVQSAASASAACVPVSAATRERGRASTRDAAAASRSHRLIKYELVHSQVQNLSKFAAKPEHVRNVIIHTHT